MVGCQGKVELCRERCKGRSRVCDNCNQLLEENKRLLAHVREGTCDSCQTYAEENAQLTQELSGLMHTLRKEAHTKAGLLSELRKMRGSDPRAKDIEFVLTRWRRLCGHPAAKCPVDGKAWKAVKRALGPWDYSLLEVLEVVDGVALAPYDAGYGKRKVAGTPKERKDDLGYALRDETNIAKFRDIARRAQGASYDQVNEAYIALLTTQEQYLGLMIEACNRRDSASLQVARAWHYSVGEEAPIRREYRHELDENGHLPAERAA